MEKIPSEDYMEFHDGEGLPLTIKILVNLISSENLMGSMRCYNLTHLMYNHAYITFIIVKLICCLLILTGYFLYNLKLKFLCFTNAVFLR